MGEDMDRARDIIAKTERRSIHTIYMMEVRLGHVTKSPKKPNHNETKLAKIARSSDYTLFILLCITYQPT